MNAITEKSTCFVELCESVIDAVTGSPAGIDGGFLYVNKKILATDTSQSKWTKMETSANAEWSPK